MPPSLACWATAWWAWALATTSGELSTELLLGGEREDIPRPPPTFRDVRVTRGFATYDTVRVSVISLERHTEKEEDDSAECFSAPFAHHWTQFHLTTKQVRVQPGTSTTVVVSRQPVRVSLPALGGSVTGVIIGDPCYSSKYKSCEFGIEYQVHRRLARALNLLAPEIDFYSLLGDNFYDRRGDLTRAFFSLLSPEAQSLFFSTVLGNHDLWAQGNPLLQVPEDQLGWGFAQYYAQDVRASRGHVPLNFTRDERGWGPADNFFSYHAVGGLGFIAYSGAHDLEPEKFEEACAYFCGGGEGAKVAMVFLMGHWSVPLLDGCRATMDVPSLFQAMHRADSGMPSCRRLLVDENRLMFLMGHVHSNVVTGPRGLMLGGAGMLGEGHFGLPVFELHADESPARLEISYFPFAEKRHDPHVHERFARFERCVAKHGSFRACKHLARTWVNGTRVLVGGGGGGGAEVA